MNEKFIIVDSFIRLHSTPLANVEYQSPTVSLMIDDPDEHRFRIEFSPYQALRITTIDCFNGYTNGRFLMTQDMYRVENSFWIREFKKVLAKADVGADFLDKSSHYIVPLQDDVLEVVAWKYEIKDVLQKHTVNSDTHLKVL